MSIHQHNDEKGGRPPPDGCLLCRVRGADQRPHRHRSVPELEQLAAVLNAEYKKIDEQMAQSKKLPTVLVKSDVVGNHRYSVPEYAKWADIVSSLTLFYVGIPNTWYAKCHRYGIARLPESS